MDRLEKVEMAFERINGSSPAENRYYILVMFDISDTKKYTRLTKLLKKYCFRIQNSVYEGYMRPSDYRGFLGQVEKIMGSERFFNPEDKIRVYKLAGSCNAVAFGPCNSDDIVPQENLFI